MVLSCQNIHKTFVDQEVLKGISFHINEKDRLAVIGLNGAGKSTLLKIIMDQMTPDDGEIHKKKDADIGYLAQHQDHTSSRTIYEELLTIKQDVIELDKKLRSLEHMMKHLSGTELEEKMEEYTRATHLFEQKNGFAYKSEITGILKGLGFQEEDFQKKIETLSGGQKTRVALGKLLLMKPEILLLDEPTNHLDVDSIQWLETYLSHYEGAVILVSHDRYFLDKIVNKVMEIESGHAMLFDGNYTSFIKKRDQVKAIRLKEYENQQQEIRHQKAVIEKLKQFNREKSIRRAESREKMLEKIEVLEKPTEVRADMHITLEPKVTSGNDVLTVEGLSKAFGSLTLFENLSFSIKRGERIALIGNNGTGKTTILKILNGLLPADNGTFSLGSKVCIGYYDQEHHVLHPEKTLFEELSDTYPDLDNTAIRSTLAAFLFTGDDVFKRIQDLSGGERGRVSLAKLMLSEANFLILDEPTNHLDIVSKEILEQAINKYTGTVLYVSHDRYFINSTATRILDLTGGVLVNYIGNYDYYLEKRDLLTPASSPVKSPAAEAESAGKLDWKQQKEEQARQRKRENDFKKTEARIFELESRDGEIDELLTREEVYTNPAECVKLHKEKEAILAELEGLYEQWEALAQ